MADRIEDATDKCTDGCCWSGPVLIFSTKGGAVIDLRTWIMITLSKHYDKATTLGMMDCLTLTHVFEEHAILAFAQGREPHGTVLREVFARIKMDHGGVLKSNCSAYHVAVIGEGEQAKCDALISHYDWIGRMARRREALIQGATQPLKSRVSAHS